MHTYPLYDMSKQFFEIIKLKPRVYTIELNMDNNVFYDTDKHFISQRWILPNLIPLNTGMFGVHICAVQVCHVYHKY